MLMEARSWMPADRLRAAIGLRETARAMAYGPTGVVVRNPKWIPAYATASREASDLASSLGVGLNVQKGEYDPLTMAHTYAGTLFESVVQDAPVADRTDAHEAQQAVVQAAGAVAADFSFDELLLMAEAQLDRELRDKALASWASGLPDAIPGGFASPSEVLAKLLANWRKLLAEIEGDRVAFAQKFESVGWSATQIDGLEAMVRERAAGQARIDALRARTNPSPIAGALKAAPAKLASEAERAAKAAERQLRNTARREIDAALRLVAQDVAPTPTPERDVEQALDDPGKYEAFLTSAYSRLTTDLAEKRDTDQGDIAEALAEVESDLQTLRDLGYPRAAVRRTIRAAKGSMAIGDPSLRDATVARFRPDLRTRVLPAVETELAALRSEASEAEVEAQLNRAAKAWEARQNPRPATAPSVTPTQVLAEILRRPNQWRAALTDAFGGDVARRGQSGDELPPQVVTAVMADLLDDLGVSPRAFALREDYRDVVLELRRRVLPVATPEATARLDRAVERYRAEVAGNAKQADITAVARGAVNAFVRESTNSLDIADPFVTAIQNPQGVLDALDRAAQDGVDGFVARGYSLADAKSALASIETARNELRTYHARRADILRSLRTTMREMETNIRDILVAGLANQQAVSTRVVDSVIAQTGLEGEEADRAREGLTRVLQEEITKRAAATLEAIERRAKTPQKRAARKQMHDQLVMLAALGGLTPNAGHAALARALGLDALPEGTEARVAELIASLDEVYRGFGPGAQETARRFQELKDYIAQQLTARKPWHKRWMDRMLAVFYPSVLSGLDTQITNIVGNLWKGGVTAFEETMVALATRRLSASDTAWAMGQLCAILPEAWQIEARSSIQQGVSLSRVQGKFQDSSFRYSAEQLPGFLRHLRLVGRLMGAGDAMFFHAAKENALLQETLAGFLAEGLSSEEARARTVEVLQLRDMERFEAQAREQWQSRLGVANPTPVQIKSRALELRDEARAKAGVRLEHGMEAGAEATFTAPIKSPFIRSVVESLNRIKDRLPAANFVVPFTTIAGKLTDSALDYMPVSAWARTFGAFTEAQKHPEDAKLEHDFHLALLRASEGFALTVAIVLLLASEKDKEPKDRWFDIWGPGPKDYKQNAQWRQTGARAYHMRVGGVMIDYRPTPAFLALGVLGSVMDSMRFEPDPAQRSFQAAALVALTSSVSVPAEQSFLKGVKDFIDLLVERNPQQRLDKSKDLIASITTNLVPGSNFFRQMHRMADPTIRQTDGGLIATILAQTPVASGLLPGRVNALGTVMKGDRPVVDRLALFGGPDPVEDPDDLRIFESLTQRNIYLSVPSPRETALINKQDLRKSEYHRLEAEYAGKTMDPEQYTRFMAERGQRFKARLLPRLEGLEKLDRDEMQREVQKMLERSSTEARRVVLGLNPRR